MNLALLTVLALVAVPPESGPSNELLGGFVEFVDDRLAECLKSDPHMLSRRSVRAARIMFRDGGVAAEGFAIIDFAQLGFWHSVDPIGNWTFWYSNGARKADVRYYAGCRVFCGPAGHQQSVYSYPSGVFTYLWPSGRLMAQGRLERRSRNYSNNCEGGQDVYFSRVTSNTKFFGPDGKPVDAEDARLAVEDIELWGLDTWDSQVETSTQSVPKSSARRPVGR